MKLDGAIAMAPRNTKGGSFASDMRVLLKSGEGSDVILVAGASQLRAHSFILAARSPVFAAMLRSDMKEAHNRRIEISDVQEDVLQQLLSFMYTDTAPRLAGTAAELLAAADKYDLPLLKTMCEEKLAQNLTVDNAGNAAALAVLHSCPGLKSATVDFIASHPEVMISGGWINVLRTNAEAAAEVCSLVAAAKPKIRTTSVKERQDLTEWMMVAARTGDVGELRRLLAAGAPVDAKDGSGYTALHLAAMDAGAGTVKCLLDAGADVEVRDSSQQTPLHAAAYRGNLQTMWALLTTSAQVDARDRWGKTPLHWAAATKQVEAVRTLLLAGADKKLKDNDYLTPQDTAAASTRELFRAY